MLGWDASEVPLQILIGKPEWKRPLGGPGCRWDDNIKMDLNIMSSVGVYV
jgi:hypothetical protein